jgi:cholesterol transport system auxiliary component
MMRHRRFLSVFLVASLALFVFLTGCVGRKYVEKGSFALDVPPNGAASSSESDAVLRVRTLRVSPRYEGKSFVYRTSDLAYESDYYNQFFAPPDTMITEEVRDWLGSSGLFKEVVDYTGQVEHTHVLEGEVIDLYGDYSERGSSRSKAVLGIEFRFIHEIDAEPKLIFQKRYRKAVPVASPAPDVLVRGWNDALQKILTELEADLRKAPLSG